MEHPNERELNLAETKVENERRRVPRLTIAREVYRHSPSGKVFGLCDLSETGLAVRIIDAEDFALFPVGAQVDGWVNLKGQKYSVRLQSIRIGRDRVGFQFQKMDKKTQQALVQFLDPHTLASELKAIPTRDPDSEWFHGPTGTEVFIWRASGGRLHHALIVMGGHAIEWHIDQGWSTGTVENFDGPLPELRGVVSLETLEFRPDLEPVVGQLNIAKTLILSSNLPQDFKKLAEKLELKGN